MSPFALLRQLEQLGRDHGAQMPVREAPAEVWEGVGFRLGAQHFVCAMGEVTELLKYPELSPIPRTRSWVRGMANVRGNLLPVMDLNGFLGGVQTSLTRSSRVIVIDIDGVFAGLLVDEVLGMRHFLNDDFHQSAENVAEDLAPFISGRFHTEGVEWLVFSMRALAQSTRFIKVAI